MTCAAFSPSLTLPAGLWNVFARSHGAVSDPIVVNGASPPQLLTLALAPAASLVVQLPAGHTGVVYATKHVTAFPIAERTSVPPGEELWLFVLAKSDVVGVHVIPPVESGSERVVDARNPSPPAAVGWLQLPDADRIALKAARDVAAPRIRITSAGKESEARSLPAPEALGGAFVLFYGPFDGDSELQLAGRGFFPLRRKITIGTQTVTPLRQPIVVRTSATLLVKWSTPNDLPALDRSLGSCEPSTQMPQFELTISSCPPARPGERFEEVSCQPIRTERLRSEATFGSLTIDDLPPGVYRAQLQFGRLPPAAATATLAPLQQQTIEVEAAYIAAYGSLTRGGRPLGKDARITFPGAGLGFAEGKHGEYHAVLRRPVGDNSKIDIATCSGERAFVLTDKPMIPRVRFDIDIPDNVLTVTVIDTFSRMLLPTATLRCVVMSASAPRRPVLTIPLQPGGEESSDGRFVLRGVPLREIRLQASNPGYRKQDVDPFSLSKSEKKEVEIQLVPLNGSEGKILSPRPFEKGTIIWSSANGAETERADLFPDGTFTFEGSHFREETMTVVSLSHPLWITRAPLVERRKPLEVRFPDAAPVREADVVIENAPIRMVTLIGVTIGGLRVPHSAFVQHLALRNLQAIAVGNAPLQIPALAETGSITILRGPSILQRPPPTLPVDPLAFRDFGVVDRQLLQPGIDRVVFGGK